MCVFACVCIETLFSINVSKFAKTVFDTNFVKSALFLASHSSCSCLFPFSFDRFILFLVVLNFSSFTRHSFPNSFFLSLPTLVLLRSILLSNYHKRKSFNCIHVSFSCHSHQKKKYRKHYRALDEWFFILFGSFPKWIVFVYFVFAFRYMCFFHWLFFSSLGFQCKIYRKQRIKHAIR